MPKDLVTLSLLWSFVLLLAPGPAHGDFNSGDCTIDDSPEGNLVTSFVSSCSSDRAAVEVAARSYDDIRNGDRSHASLLLRIDYICVGNDSQQIRGTPWTTDYRDRRIDVTNLDTFFDVKNENNPQFTATVQQSLPPGTNCTFYLCYKQRRVTPPFNPLGRLSPVSCVTDTNECGSVDSNNCHENAQCTNTVGSFTCSCNPGYTGDGVNCMNIDECELGTNTCSSNANCTDTDGSFNCTCREGFEGDGFICTDINECDSANGGCEHSCTNTIGSFTCSCDTGYQLDETGLNCTDINECEVDDSNNCHENAQCTNTVGSYTCSCNPGYTGDGVNCTDINECGSDDSNNCHENAQCTNTEGSYTCSCNPGYTGDGVTCTSINECELEMHTCHVNANCTDTIGSFTCTCGEGFEGDGITCTDIDECRSDALNNCHKYAQCINIEGTFACSCYLGYIGDGRECTGLILPAMFVITGVLIIVIVLLCGVICVMYNYRREATRKSEFHKKFCNSKDSLPVEEPDMLSKQEVKVFIDESQP